MTGIRTSILMITKPALYQSYPYSQFYCQQYESLIRIYTGFMPVKVFDVHRAHVTLELVLNRLFESICTPLLLRNDRYVSVKCY